MKSKLPEPGFDEIQASGVWTSSNPNLRRLGFDEIQTPGLRNLDFRKTTKLQYPNWNNAFPLLQRLHFELRATRTSFQGPGPAGCSGLRVASRNSRHNPLSDPKTSSPENEHLASTRRANNEMLAKSMDRPNFRKWASRVGESVDFKGARRLTKMKMWCYVRGWESGSFQ